MAGGGGGEKQGASERERACEMGTGREGGTEEKKGGRRGE